MTDTTQQVKWERSSNHCIHASYRGYKLYVEAYDNGSVGWEIEQLDAPPPIDDHDTAMNIEDAQRAALSAVDAKYATATTNIIAETTAPRCPSCGAAMISWTDGDGTTTWVCHRVHTPARVPCPACEGDGYELLSINEGDYIAECKCHVCRGRGDVSSALAAAWLSDAPHSSERSGGEG